VKERKDRVDDALHATRAAVEEGIVPGGGVALLYASARSTTSNRSNDDQKTGIDIVRKALSAPLARSPKTPAMTVRSSSARSSDEQRPRSSASTRRPKPMATWSQEGHHRSDQGGPYCDPERMPRLPAC
jgi:hypothetical protein